jgi:uncharacterized membrane-anchored protein
MDELIDESSAAMMSKVPAVVLAFWIIKICATTAGETSGGAPSMTLGFGYAISTLIFLGILSVLLAAQVGSRSYHPFLYWGVFIATTTTGTTISDYLNASSGSAILSRTTLCPCGPQEDRDGCLPRDFFTRYCIRFSSANPGD